MKKRNRNILIIVLGVFLVLGGLGAYGVYRIYKFVAQMSTSRELPAEIKKARVLKGGDFLTKTEFFKLDHEGLLKAIGKGSDIKDEEEREKFTQSQVAKGVYNFADIKVIGYEIVAVGEFGAYVFELNGNLKREVVFDLVKEKIKIGPYEQDHFRSELDNLKIVQLETNVYGFLSYGTMQGVRIFDQNGHQIWEHGKETLDLSELSKSDEERQADDENSTYVLEAAVGDLDNDGISEYVVAKKKDGIHAFDRAGREMWSKPASFPRSSLEVRDLDGDGKNELIQVGEYVRSGIDGEYIRQIKGDSNAAVLFAPDKKKGMALQYCDVDEKRMICRDEKGTVLLDGEAPLNELKSTEPTPEPAPSSTPIYHDNGTAEAPVEFSRLYEPTESIYKPHAVWVTLRKDKPKYLAVVGAYIGLPRANLYIYEPNGTLVYHELLPENAETIAVLPGENGVEGLLVGGKDTIWKYGN